MRSERPGDDTYLISRVAKNIGSLEDGDTVDLFLAHSPGDELVEIAFGFMPTFDGLTIEDTAKVYESTYDGSYLQIDENLADLNDAPTARDNLGLGDSATKDVGTGAGTVAAGDHDHSGVYSEVGHTHELSDVTDAGTMAAQDDAPSDGTQYVRSDAGWEAIDASTIDHGSLDGLEDPEDHEQYQRLTGFPYDPVSGYEVTLSYDDGTRQVTITPTGATFDVWIDGVRYTKTGAQSSTAHANTSGEYFIYYDETATLTTSTSAWSILRHAPVCSVIYDAGTSTASFVLFELHKAGRNLLDHYYKHFSHGTVISSTPGPPTLGDYTLDSATTAGVTFSATAVRLMDEDIVLDTAALTDGDYYRVAWRSGADGDWVIQDSLLFGDFTAIPFLSTGTTIAYNQWTGATWQKTALSLTGSGNWVNVYLCATTDIIEANRWFLVPGQTVYTSLIDAKNANPATAIAWGDSSPQEFVLLAKLSYHAQTSHGTTSHYAELEAVEILAGTKSGYAASPGVTDHGALSGLSDADHVAGSISFTDTNKLLGRSTAGAGAGEEITCTTAGRALIDDASAGDQRTTLGLGDSATKNVGTGATNVAAGNHTHTGVYSPVGHTHTVDDVTDAGSAAKADTGDFLQVANDGSDINDTGAFQDNLFGSGAQVTRHWHPLYQDDFQVYRYEHWKQSVGGSGTSYLYTPSSWSVIENDGQPGYIFATCGGGTASTDKALIYWQSYNGGPDVTASGFRFIWRAGIVSNTNMLGSIGIARTNSAPTTPRPSPSFCFVFDSASSANIRCKHDDGAGNTSDQDSSVTLASINVGGAGAFAWFEIRGTGSSVTFYINGSLVATQSPNLPTSTNKFQSPFMFCQGAGTTWRGVWVDKFMMIGPGGCWNGSVI